MASVQEIHIRGLFGLYDHSIRVRSKSPVTIVAGPNGIGKTTLLHLTRALLRGWFHELARHEFTTLSVVMSTGETLIAAPLPPVDDSEDAEPRLRLELQSGRSKVEQIVSASSPLADVALPPYIEQLGRDQYFDSRAGEYLSTEDVVARYQRQSLRRRGMRSPEDRRVPDWYQLEDWKVDFIETKRLDTLVTRSVQYGRRGDRVVAPINVYLGNVRQTLEDARRESTLIRQARDRSFVRRLLNRARDTVNETLLRERYSRVEAQAEELRTNGLLSETLEVLPGGKLTPTNKRIVSLFLDDFEAKLVPLLPASAKLERLRSVVGHKFLNKTLAVLPAGIVFLAEPNRQEIAPDALSSGEQHALALISRLLFTEEPGTTVLIDEPELSLHVSWQHEMIDDLIEIADVVGLKFVLATHSTAIINNRWDLVEELGPIEAAGVDD